MDREILFRGKRLDKFRLDEWIYGYYVPCCFGSFPCRPAIVPGHDGQWEPFEVDPSTVGQYIGLTDKNSTKIFKGDVVTAQLKSNHSKQKFEVIFKEGAFQLDGYIIVGFADVYNLNIIGNIYDNPELIANRK